MYNIELIDPQYVNTLHIIYSRLEDKEIQWVITGSMGMVLHGMDLDIHDIDIQTDEQDAYKFEKLFSEYIVTPVYYWVSERIRSHFGSLNIGNVNVEIMGGMQKFLPDQVWEDPVNIQQYREWVTFEGMNLPVLSLDYEHQAYLALGRHEKAEKIRRWLANQ